MGSVFKRKKKDGIAYRAKVIDDTGIPIYKTFSKKKDAEFWIATQEVRKKVDGLHKKDHSCFFGAYSKFWLSEKVGKSSNRSIENWESVLRIYILPKFKDKRMSAISYQDGVDFQKWLTCETKLSNKTINHIVATFGQILIYATKGQGFRRQLNSNPIAGIEKLPVIEDKFKFWEREEVVSFLRDSREFHYYDVYLFAINTGCRLGEIAGLQKSKIDFRKSIITISNALKREKNEQVLGKTKTGRTRHFPMNKILSKMLLKRVEELSSEDFIFTNKDGHSLDVAHFSRVFLRDQKIASVKNKIRFHDLRHTFASNFVMNGGDIFVLQKLLGHSSIEMTMKYAHLSPKHFQNISDVVQFSGEIE